MKNNGTFNSIFLNFSVEDALISTPYTGSYVFLICLVIFLTGLVGLAIVNNNLLVILLSIEMMFFGLGLFAIFFAQISTNYIGFIIAITLITISAAETVIGLSLLVRYCILFDKVSLNLSLNPYKPI